MDPWASSFLATEHCGLCLLRFPTGNLADVDLWQLEFRAVLCLDPGDENTIEVTRPAILPSTDDDEDVSFNVSLTGHPPDRTFKICRATRWPKKKPPALCFHDWCYTVLKSNLESYSKVLIYKLVRSLAPTPRRWENIWQGHNPGFSWHSLQPLFASVKRHTHDAELGFMLRMPTEVASPIWEHVGLNTPYSAFMIIEGETSHLAKQLRNFSRQNLSLAPGSHVFAKTIHIFGIEYIQELLQDGPCDEDANFKSNVLGEVNDVKFVAGPNGICAIKLLGSDWETDWIGNVPKSACVWYGMVRGVKSGLRCRYTELNCIDVLSTEARSRSQVVWDHANIPSSLLDPNTALFDYERDILRSHIEPERRFFRYLSLYDNGEYIKGLTVYLSNEGIVGFQVHFSTSSRTSGLCDGCALYFHLQPNERIAHAWLRIRDSPNIEFATPALLIQTTSGRIHWFGSYIWPGMVMANRFKWFLLKKKGNIAGLYYENSADQIIRRVGVTDDSAPVSVTALPPRFHFCDIPPQSFPGPNAGLFLSVASLAGADKVDACIAGDRYIGILIHYKSGVTTALGQWHASNTLQHSRIHSTPEVPITHICFKTSPHEDHQIVTNIKILTKGVDDLQDSSWQIFDIGQGIAWWFSLSFDTVLPWSGEVLDVPERNRKEHPED